MVFYLKMNRLRDYSIRNLQKWIETIALFDNPVVYVLSDNTALNERIENEIDFYGVNWSWLKSIKRGEDESLVNAIAVPKWRNAAYAHMTPFIHSKENGFESFWNIDADDTLFALSPERVKEALTIASTYARKESIDLFSLDMWRSRSNSMHWSFGITFSNGKIDWIELMRSRSDCKNGSKYFINGKMPKNIDEFFTYIKAIDSRVRIETFYIENLLFLHYSDDFILYPIVSGVFKWSKGKLIYPIIKYIYGIDSLGEISISEDVIKFDIGISDNEGGWSLACIAPFSIEATNIIEAEEYEKLRESKMQGQIKETVESIINKLNNRNKTFIFGFGKYTGYLTEVLNEYGINVLSVIDNAEFKWGIKVNGYIIESPSTLNNYALDSINVLIDVRHYDAIFNQLLKMGIKPDQVFKAVNYENAIF